MATGISIHIGVNQVDPAHYGHGVPELFGAEADALAMAGVAEAAGFRERTTLLGPRATAEAVIGQIRADMVKLHADDLLLITFSGHGSRVRDEDEDEDDYDETWCVYDRQIIDDELYALWTEANPGTRIVVVSDSCFSGDVVRDALESAVLAFAGNEEGDGGEETARSYSADPLEEARRRGLTPRGLPPRMRSEIYERHATTYLALKQAVAPRQRVRLKASVLLLSASSEYEPAVEKDGHGVFTRALLDAWASEELRGGYHDFHAVVFRAVKKYQSPGYRFADGKNDAFLKQPPFFIDDVTWRGRPQRLRSAALGQRASGSVHQT